MNVGAAKSSALVKCGEPLIKDSFCKPAAELKGNNSLIVPPNGAVVVAPTQCETVDEWTYNPGRGQFMTTLRFESGKLTSITYGDRVN